MSTSGGVLRVSTLEAANKVPLASSSAVVANAAATATLAANATLKTYCTGFEVTATGATAVLIVTVTVTGAQNTLNYVFVFPAGVTTLATPLIVAFPEPLVSSAVNTAIVVTLPASGAGGTNAAVTAHGYWA